MSIDHTQESFNCAKDVPHLVAVSQSATQPNGRNSIEIWINLTFFSVTAITVFTLPRKRMMSEIMVNVELGWMTRTCRSAWHRTIISLRNLRSSGPIHAAPETYWKRSVISAFKPTIHTNIIRHENGAFRKHFSNRTNLKNARFTFWCGQKTILKTDLFENDDVTIIMWFPWPTFPQTQIQNDRWLLHFQISLAFFGRKTFYAFFGTKTPFSNFSGVMRTGNEDERM